MAVPHSPFLKPCLIFLGAGGGGVLRYWLTGAVQCVCGEAFPLGTMLVNVSGCLAMGFLAALWQPTELAGVEYRSALLVGVLGGYTTFSSFGHETMMLAQDGQRWQAAAYVAGTLVMCLLAVWIGEALASRLGGPGVT